MCPKCLFSLLLLLFFSAPAFSQDDIIMRNDDVIKGRVEEVGLNVIRYHRADNIDGPVYDLPKGDVYMIVYANGARDVITPRGGDAPPPADAQIRTAPPEMPVYEQPFCPGPGYLWTPGYWAFGPGGYYWVPGVWVMAPRPNYLWTPGYWGFVGGFYGWHEGYWGEHIGFYGGVNYGYGYGGSGYYGGRWEGGQFRYNTAVSRVDVTVVHTTYVDNTVIHNTTVVNHSSFNGEGGIKAEPTPQEKMATNENHVKPTTEQTSHVQAARNDKSQYVSANHGKPATTAMNKPGGEHYSPEGHKTEAAPAAHTGAENNQHGATNTEHGATNQQHGTTNTEHGTTNQQHGTTNTEHGATNEQHGNQAQPGSQQHGNTAQPGHQATTPKPAAKPAAKPAPKPAARPASRPEEHR